MDAHNQTSEIRNENNEQCIFTSPIDTYDPNLGSVARYSPTPAYNSSNVNAYNAAINQSTNIIAPTKLHYSTNCVTYSNVIFLPNTTTNTVEHADLMEIVKNESVISSANSNSSEAHSYKYIVSSDPRFLNSFIRNGNLIENTTEVDLNSAIMPVNRYLEQTQHIVSVPAVDDENLITSHLPHVGIYQQQNHHHLHHQHQPNESETDVIIGPDGQLYRQVLVNHNDIGSSAVELVSTSIAEAMINDVGYVNEPYNTNHNVSQQHVGPSYEIHTTMEGLSTSKAIGESQIITNISQNNHPVELVYGNYNDCSHIQSEINQYTILESINRSDAIHGQHPDLMNRCNTNVHNSDTSYQSNVTLSTMDKDQQRILLESTMSPLLATVNDINARHEQFQSFTSDTEANNKPDDINMAHYPNNCSSSSTNIHDKNDKNQHSSHYCVGETPVSYSTQHIHQADIQSSATQSTSTVTSSKIYTSNYENTRISCATPDEYVDINDMEFVQTRDEYGTDKENMLMRRAQRKRTVKKNEELTVADKHVPCRALATLPTSYLFIGNSIDDPSRDTVFAKKDIPLRTKFGPFEGDVKTLKPDEIERYKENCHKIDRPVLFLSDIQILDTANEFTSNWMRYVYLATNYAEQNLILHELESKLYYKSCQFIRPKQQLKLGYSKEYAEKYNLPLLRSDENEKQEFQESQNFLNDQKIETIEKFERKTKNCDEQKQNNVLVNKTEENNIPTVHGKYRLNTGVLRKRKLARSKLSSRESGPIVRYACHYCSKVFSKLAAYKKHTNAVHPVDVDTMQLSMNDPQAARETLEEKDIEDKEKNSKWFTCYICQRYFSTPERLEKHRLLHCKTEIMSVQCHLCPKRVLTPSALTMHLKTHNSTKNGFFRCPFCTERYQNTLIFKDHVKIHMKNGSYFCPVCNKEFKQYSAVRKHIQLNHSSVRYKCLECEKDFKSKYKLREHKLRHSDVRQFLCADCGKQFKRKDKLKEHILKIHKTKLNTSKMIKKGATNEDNDEAHVNIQNYDSDTNILDSPNCPTQSSKEIEVAKSSRFCPKVPPTDYQRFIYKCHDCLLGFKRRGMLVNHLAKRHPAKSISSIPELNLPILKTQRCYYCQYCDKSYKSSSKRKAHILKYHPGLELPVSTRQNSDSVIDDTNMPNPSFSRTIGSITTQAHQCPNCHKQYASRTRLLQHQRTSHGGYAQTGEMKNNVSFNHYDFSVSEDHNIYSNYQQSPNEDSVDMENCKMVNYSEIHENTHQFLNFEPENKLLKLSSAALEASLRDDFHFFHQENEDKSLCMDRAGLAIGLDISSTSREEHCFKDMTDDFADNSNCDLNPFPQLFEGIDC